MSPIDHLPPEILSTIFLHILPPFDVYETPERVPKVLAQVCRLWHTLALALPGLWASLNIECNHHTLHPPLHIIRTHLLRSAAHPLSIIFNTNLGNPRVRNPHFPAVLAALVATSKRWRHISITLASEATAKTFDLITQGDAPLLQSFDCKIEQYTRYQIPPIPLRALQRWARLESLTWSSVGMSRQDLALGHDSWPRLTTLDFQVPLSASECLTLLQLSPRLSTAIFHRINRPGDDTSRHLTHATLQSLHAEGACITSLIDAITLPVLVDLRLCLDNSPSSSASDTILHPFFVRSAPPLHTLSITNMHTPEPVLLRVLALVGGLHTLSVRDLSGDFMPPTAALIHAFHPPPPPGPLPLCPSLRTLHIYALDAPDGVCAAMLRARWGMEASNNGVASLRTVSIALCGDGHERDYAQMRALDAEGMDVRFWQTTADFITRRLRAHSIAENLGAAPQTPAYGGSGS